MHLLKAALWYQKNGFSVIPAKGKRPNIASWARFQRERASAAQIRQWADEGLIQNIAVIMGRVSYNAVCIDLDGLGAVAAFWKQFPHYKNTTFTVLSGSHEGQHLYFRVRDLPKTLRIKTHVGGFELRSDGAYMIAPPSVHPKSGKAYEMIYRRPIAFRDNLNDVITWLESMIPQPAPVTPARTTPHQPGRWQARASYMRNAYMKAAVERELSAVRRARQGERNNTLFNSAMCLGRFIAGGELPAGEIRNELLGAALATGMPQQEAERTIASGFKWGERKPRNVPAPPPRRD